MTNLFNGVKAEQSLAENRGLAFGDGLFETLLVNHGKIQWLEEHLNRLERGCQQLHLDYPKDALLKDIERVQADFPGGRAVLKILVWRKSLQHRGYRAVTRAVDRLVNIQALPDPDRKDWQDGIRVELSAHRLSSQPELAGLKHLNRLDQVLAGVQLPHGVQEALLQDQEGYVVEAIAANLFLVVDGYLRTPPLTKCGVAGIVREKILHYWQEQKKAPVGMTPVSLSTLYAAQELFICNSLIGITPVKAIGCHQKNIGPVTRHFQQQFESCWYV